jgi:hypothetical protein
MSGHWICFTRYDRNIEYFDSYGLAPDVPFSWPTNKFKDNERYLTKLLNKCKLPMVYNTIDFQNKKDLDISTCGGYAVFRILTLLEMNANLQQNNLMLKTLKETSDGLSFDDVVCNYINKR